MTGVAATTVQARVPLVVLACFLVVGCGQGSGGRQATGTGGGMNAGDAARIVVTSPTFEDGGTIPRRYTCEGQDVSPPLAWSGVPDGTRELALLVEDPDAPGGTFVHWMAWGIPPGGQGLEEGSVPEGTRQARNDFGPTGWGGPCPPKGRGAHRYVFTVVALAQPLTLEQEASAKQFQEATKGTVVGRGRLTGTFGR
jgi:Raf kinase inhibitor-like YbhB/YbcL family protein